MKPEDLIENVVFDFYQNATKDILIGYHFRKIIPPQKQNPLSPPIELFQDHLPRINAFWKQQLLGIKTHESFDLIKVHKELHIRKGELSRWILLFKESLHKFEKFNSQLVQSWEQKIDHFEQRFIRSLF